MNTFKKISPSELNRNTFNLIGKDWMLITAGNNESFNTMTASFGGFGVLFFKNVVHIYVRPERYTYEFLERSPLFTLSFFPDSLKPILQNCGKTSGRDYDKIKQNNLTPGLFDNGSVYFEQANLVLNCKVIYKQDIDKACFTNLSDYERTYNSGGMHRMYIGEILDVLIK